MEKLQGKDYVLGIQHLFAMFGATVLVPLLTGLKPEVALLTAGIGTFIFHFVTGGKVPVFLGSSFAFIAGIVAVASSYGYSAVGGGIIFAGLAYLLFSVLVYFVGVDTIRSFVPPIVTGPIIIVIGLMLSPIAVRDIIGAFGADGYMPFTGKTLLLNCIIAFFVILTIVVVMMFTKGFFKLVPILFGMLFGYIFCLILDLTGITGDAPLVNMAAIAQAPWLNFGKMARGEFFTFPTFSWGAIATIMPLALVTFIEHIGDITTNGSVVKKDFFKDPGLHRTLIGDGLATIFAGLVGGPANTTYSENTGVLAVTRNYNPKILRLAALYAIVLSLVGKFGAVLQTIPNPVKGSVSLILFGMIAAIGVRTLVDAKLDFSNSRNLLIAALIIVVGIGFSNWETGDGGIIINPTYRLSGLFLAAIIGIVANKVLPKDV